MSQKSRTVLKTFFQQGDIPTESNYVDLIDSNLNLSENNTGNIQLTGNITASGNISSSATNGTHTLGGDLTIGDDLIVIDDILIGSSGVKDTVLQRGASGELVIGSNYSLLGNNAGNTSILGLNHITASSNEIKIEATDGLLNLVGDVTASNNISASGTITGLSGSFSELSGNSPLVINSETTFIKAITASSHVSASSFIASTNITASGNISASGTLIGNSLNLGGTAVTATATEINHIDGLTSAEASQIKNINSVTISNTQWGYVGQMDQFVGTGNSVTFASVQQRAIGFQDVLTNTSLVATFSDGVITANGIYGGIITINSVPILKPSEQAVNWRVVDDRVRNYMIPVATSQTKNVVVTPNGVGTGEFYLNISCGAETFNGGTVKINFQLLGV